jgi:hypothetical protein
MDALQFAENIIFMFLCHINAGIMHEQVRVSFGNLIQRPELLEQLLRTGLVLILSQQLGNIATGII